MSAHGNMLRAAEVGNTRLAQNIRSLQIRMDGYDSLLHVAETAEADRAENVRSLQTLLKTHGEMLEEFTRLQLQYMNDSTLASHENDEALKALSLKAERCLALQMVTLERIDQGLTHLIKICSLTHKVVDSNTVQMQKVMQLSTLNTVLHAITLLNLWLNGCNGLQSSYADIQRIQSSFCDWSSTICITS